MNGFITIDKPPGPSSYGAVNEIKKAFGERKVGHAGTLDPAASGVLVVALGQATRLLPYLPLEPKVYEFGIQFGTETDTLDAQGKAVKEQGRIPAPSELETVLKEFTGLIQQRPPAFSAIKVDGVRSYKLARREEDVELEARSIQVFSLDLLSFDQPGSVANLRVSCSGGTYVRSLARDLALRLDTFGHAGSIRRTAVGAFTVDRAIPLSALASSGSSSIIPIYEAFSGFPMVTANESQKKTLSYGQSISIDPIPAGDLPVLILDDAKDLIALVVRSGGNLFKPARVFVSR